MGKSWLFLLFLSFSFVFAGYVYLDQPPILINNPLYSFYKSILNFTLKLPMSAFAKSDILIKGMEESLYNLAFALDNQLATEKLIIEFRRHGFALSNILRKWRNFKREPEVVEKVLELQGKLFQLAAALNYQPFLQLSRNEQNALKQVFQILFDESYDLLGAKKTFANLQSLNLPTEDLIYLANNYFQNRRELLVYFSSILKIKLTALAEEKGTTEVLTEIQTLAEKLLPPKNKLRNLIVEIASTSKAFLELNQLLNEGKAYLTDFAEFERLSEAYQQELNQAKETALQGDFESATISLQKLKEILTKLNALFVLVEEEPVIKPEIPLEKELAE